MVYISETANETKGPFQHKINTFLEIEVFKPQEEFYNSHADNFNVSLLNLSTKNIEHEACRGFMVLL